MMAKNKEHVVWCVFVCTCVSVFAITFDVLNEIGFHVLDLKINIRGNNFGIINS